MPRLLPIYRRTLTGQEQAAPKLTERTANTLDIKNVGTLLVYDVQLALRASCSREVSLQVRKALRDTDLTAMVLTLKQSNFPDGPFEALATPVTFSAAGIAKVPVSALFLAIETTTAGSASGAQEVEVGAVVGEEHS